MQDAGWWDPSVEDRAIFRPLLSRGLTATNQNASPEPMDAMLEEVQLVDVAGDSMVLVITRYDLLKPCTDFDHAIMHPALKLSLDSFELRSHSLLRSDPPDGEGFGLVALPTVVGEAQEREGLRFPLATLLPVTGRIAPELDQSCLVRM